MCTADVVYAEFESKLMGFVDDVEFYFQPKGDTVEYRSASRLGESDFDVNRKRIRQIRVALMEMVCVFLSLIFTDMELLANFQTPVWQT